MLRVAGLRDRTGRYYLADLAAEPGPVGEGLAPEGTGRWTGEGAAVLGLSGPVGSEALAHVLSGRHPSTGGSLVARRGSVAGFDLTFAAPKSVSVLLGTGAPPVATAVAAAHREAVAGAIGYVGRHALGVRRGSSGDRQVLAVEGVIAAAFTHGVSRALDPHLHTHVVVANVARGADGRWTGVDGRGLFAHAEAAGQLYDAELRHRLSERLDVAWVARAGGHYEVRGITEEVIAGFSSRRAEIGQHAALAGARSPRGRQVAWAATRDPKTTDVDPGALRQRWTAWAAGVGLDREAVGDLVDRGRRERAAGDGGRPATPSLEEHRFAAALARSPEGTAARREAVAAWAGAVDRGVGVADVERSVDALAAWGNGVGVAEHRRALAELVPAPHLLRALGPRPAQPDALGAWQAAAKDIDRYRARWSVGDPLRPLGLEGDGVDLAGMAVPRLADHLAVGRRVAEVRSRLGRPVDRQRLRLDREWSGRDLDRGR